MPLDRGFFILAWYNWEIMNNLLTFLKSKKFLTWGAIVVAAFLVLGFGYPIYDEWKGRRGVENLAKALKQFEKDDYNAAMADTYGGKTPQETLGMYIDAIEKGDYELASKYFIGDKQKEELDSFVGAKPENIQNIITLLKKAIEDGGEYAIEGKYFSFNGSLLVRMKLYPNGIWKIIEI